MGFQKIDQTFSEKALRLLCSKIGIKLNKFICNEISPWKLTLEGIALCFDYETLILKYEEMGLNIDGCLEDYQIMRVEPLIQEPFDPGIRPYRLKDYEVNKPVEDIKVINNTISLFKNTKKIAEACFTNGVAVHVPDHAIAFEQPIWYEDNFIVHSDLNYMSKFLPSDCGWEYEKPYHAECKREIISLKDLR